jgi:hypothetical protein
MLAGMNAVSYYKGLFGSYLHATSKRLRMNVHLKAAILSISEINLLCSPNLFECFDRLTARFGVPRFQLVDRPLGQADTPRELGLIPAQDSAGQPDFGCKRGLLYLCSTILRAIWH